MAISEAANAYPKDAQRRAEEELAFLAYHDPLTGLPNRALIEERLEVAVEQASEAKTELALLYIDLNDFKLVNDSLGHAAGDELLCQVATRLREATREGDVLARQGGDEFLVLAAGAGAGAAVALGARIATALRAPFLIGDAELVIEASVGASVFPLDAGDVETLRKHADTAMYQAKAASSGFALYRAGDSDPLYRLSLAARLRRALEREEFELHYQPIVRLDTGEVLELEALIRWRDPEHGLVPPGDFVPVAEQTGLIDALGDWVLRRLCEQATEWNRRGFMPRFGINVSPRQLRRAGFPLAFAREIRRRGLDPKRFVIEVTESVWSVDASRTLPVLTALRQAGLRLAMDDFGAGYSSLARLRALPVDVIKIDRAFMDGVPGDPQAEAVITAILQLAEAFDYDVVAEGIETEEQRCFLLDRGCRLGQGFHLGRPTPPEETAELLERQRQAA
jgi:diguanylate cyclase (GGDEF)-like protein